MYNNSSGNIAIEMSQSQLSGKSSSKSGNNNNTNTNTSGYDANTITGSTGATSVSSLSFSDNVLKICVDVFSNCMSSTFFLCVKRYSQTKV